MKPAQICRETPAIGPIGPLGPVSGEIETRPCGNDHENADTEPITPDGLSPKPNPASLDESGKFDVDQFFAGLHKKHGRLMELPHSRPVVDPERFEKRATAAVDLYAAEEQLAIQAEERLPHE